MLTINPECYLLRSTVRQQRSRTRAFVWQNSISIPARVSSKAPSTISYSPKSIIFVSSRPPSGESTARQASGDSCDLSNLGAQYHINVVSCGGIFRFHDQERGQSHRISSRSLAGSVRSYSPHGSFGFVEDLIYFPETLHPPRNQGDCLLPFTLFVSEINTHIVCIL